MICNGMDWTGVERNRTEWTGMERNRTEWNVRQSVLWKNKEEGMWQGAGVIKSRSLSPVILKNFQASESPGGLD